MSLPATHMADIPSVETEFERFYRLTRAFEERIYTDEQVAVLPDIEHGHRHEQEWRIRKRSAERLVNYLKGKQQPLHILEIGCGNGWLSAAMARVDGSMVRGIDLNEKEVKQAQRVFAQGNLEFRYKSFDQQLLTGEKFDVLVFAAALPYFSSAKQTVLQALHLLKPGGEVHLTDAHFYRPDELISARKACVDYFDKMGFPEMASMYYHHTLEALDGLDYKVLIDPRNIINKYLKKEPFYWVMVKHGQVEQ